MKSAYEIAWQLMREHFCPAHNGTYRTLDQISELTGVSLIEVGVMKKKYQIVQALNPYKENIWIIKEIIEEMTQGKPHYPVIKESVQKVVETITKVSTNKKGLVQYTAPIPVQILHFMKHIKNPCSNREFADWRGLTEDQRKDLSKTFIKLLERGKIQRLTRGMYELVNHAS